jgi:NAD(P)-dependent dehydrogenase (short-subunit alcohol dehydrogenase family)
MFAEPKPVVVVTGASGGIGSAVCDLFVENGARVIGLDLREPTVSHAQYQHVQVDVTSEQAMQSCAASLDVPIQHLITCAGIARPSESAAAIAGQLIDADVFRASVNLNLVSHYVTLMALLPNLESATGDRSVTFTSSINALVGFSNTLPGYSSAKAGLLGLVRTLVVPLGELGIRVNAVLPGTVPTTGTIEEWRNDPGHFERLRTTIPLQRLPSTRDIADVFLALTTLGHVTGQSIVVDGGQSVARNS